MPNQLQEQKVFDENVAYVFDNLPLRAEQENALAASITSAVLGGAFAIPFIFDSTSTAMADPGSKKLRFNQYSNQSTATSIAVNNTDVTGFLPRSQFEALFYVGNSSAIKGHLRIIKQGDPTKWAIFRVDTIAWSTYGQLNGAFIGWSEANPFSNGDTLLLQGQRTGDVGQQGANGRDYVLATVDIASTGALSMIEFQSLFTNSYDSYTIECQGIMPSTGDYLYVKLWTGGAALSAGYSNQTSPWAADNYVGSSGNSQFSVGNGSAVGSVTSQTAQSTYPRGFSGSITIRNARSAANTTRFLSSKGTLGNAGNLYAVDTHGFVNSAAAIDGFRLYFATQTISAGIVRIIGHRNT
jgi:hypothetical protein